ncbi:sialate O-acetylesterase, partial [Bacteroidota bacterium]
MDINRSRELVLAGVFLVGSVTQIQAQMRLPLLIGDGMVMQRNQQVPIWGWSNPGDEVDVMFRDQLYESTAGEDGAWRITLPAMHHGGPYEMSIVSGDSLTKISDILIGDVWVCSGQSNM